MSVSSTEKLDDSRLGKCEVCNSNDAKYTCPKCEVKTCRLECLKIHKKELDCNGVRDKTKYVSLKNLTENDLMNDYVFLEDCTNYTMARKRDKIKRHTSNHPLPMHLRKLRSAAQERSMNLRFLLANFKRHIDNKTFYDWKTKIIHWSIEWRFPYANNFLYLEERCDENQTICKHSEKFFDKNTTTMTQMSEYLAKGISNCIFLLKSEGIQRCNERYFRLNGDISLMENLKNRTIIEFPVILVVFDSDIQNYQLITNDEEESEKHRFKPNRNLSGECNEKRRKINSENVEKISEKLKSSSRNYLFTNEDDFYDDDDDDDDDNNVDGNIADEMRN